MPRTMKYSTEVIEEWIRRVNEEASKPLTQKEQDFMISITDQFDRSAFLTEVQIDWLEDIYANKTS